MHYAEILHGLAVRALTVDSRVLSESETFKKWEKKIFRKSLPFSDSDTIEYIGKKKFNT